MTWDKNDYYAAAMIILLLVAGSVIGIYGLRIMEEPKTVRSTPVYPTNFTGAAPENDTLFSPSSPIPDPPGADSS